MLKLLDGIAVSTAVGVLVLILVAWIVRATDFGRKVRRRLKARNFSTGAGPYEVGHRTRPRSLEVCGISENSNITGDKSNLPRGRRNRHSPVHSTGSSATVAPTTSYAGDWVTRSIRRRGEPAL